jgi:hypothetical protein
MSDTAPTTRHPARATYVRSPALHTALCLVRDLTSPEPHTVEQTRSPHAALITTIETFERNGTPLAPVDVVILCEEILTAEPLDAARLMIAAFADELVSGDYDFEDLFARCLLRAGRDFTGEGTTELTDTGKQLIRQAVNS